MENETEIEKLARIIKSEFDGVRAEMRDGFAEVRGEMRAGFAAEDKRLDVLNQKIDRVDAKLDQHRQETKAEHAALRGVVGGMSHTLADHEERIKALEGE